jgi:predicted HTH domain antitoxin
MKSICIEIPDDLNPIEWGSDEAFVNELRVAAAIQWYSRGVISQSRAAEIAGLDRTSFLNALNRAEVDAFQITDEELSKEIECGLEAHRQRLANNLPD